jgi:hypothetical protein
MLNEKISSCHVGADRLCRTILLSNLAHRMPHRVGELMMSHFPRIAYNPGLHASGLLNILPFVASYSFFLSFKLS